MKWRDRRAKWAPVLGAEVTRWSGKPCEQLIDELRESQAYQIEVESKLYQFEVLLVENTSDYVHVTISVDDGRLPESMFPLTEGFIKEKTDPSTDAQQPEN
ncbi:MAG TPA: hypothetical protein VN612_14535 [Acidobacteriaceae bacterium]|nr:hypothetical protein [Acidobacteriaceae bacterium]